jgi:hypothetical protein
LNGIYAISYFFLTLHVIDAALQELAIGFEHNKRAVVMVLDKGAWGLLTIPGGAQKAKTVADTSLSTRPTTTSQRHSAPHSSPLAGLSGRLSDMLDAVGLSAILHGRDAMDDDFLRSAEAMRQAELHSQPLMTYKVCLPSFKFFCYLMTIVFLQPFIFCFLE